MSEKEEYRCLAVYLYYNEPWENFLSEAVLPYVNTTLKTGIASHYFFIRYWEKGPHIRLRFFGEESLLKEVLQANLAEHFQNYFDSKPSQRIAPDYPENVPKDIRWANNNYLEFVEYQPESKRYGGPIGLKMAEKQFYASSDAVMQMIASKADSWTYEDALGTAIKLHLGFVHCMGMSIKEARSFFHFFFHNWLPRSVRHQNQEQLLTNLNAFEKAYEEQKGALIPFHRQLWNGLDQQTGFEEVAFNQWIQSNNDFKEAFRQAQSEALLKPRPRIYQYDFWPESTAVNPADRERWMHFADYIHMTNNRLGILNRDEGYLGFLMMRCME